MNTVISPLLSAADSSPISSEPRGKWCKTVTLIFVVLFVSGVLAFGLSVVIFYFTDENSVPIPGIPPISNTWIVIILVLCGILALGLPTAVWKFFGKLDDDSESFTVPNVAYIRPEIVRIINSSLSVNEKMMIGYYDEFDKKEILEKELEKLSHIIIACLKLNGNGKLEFKDQSVEQKLLALSEYRGPMGL